MTTILSDSVNMAREARDWADEIMDMIEKEQIGSFNTGNSLKKEIQAYLEGRLSDIIWDLEKVVDAQSD